MGVGEYTSESWNTVTKSQLVKQDSPNDPQYYQLLTGPLKLSEIEEEQQRYLTKIPSWSGTGATYTWWYRHIECTGSPSCGGYLFYVGNFLYSRTVPDSTSFVNWAIWVENDAIWLDQPGNGYYVFQDFGIISRYRLSGDRIWRHMALQFNEDQDSIVFFIDGVEAFTEYSPTSPVREVDKATAGGFDTAMMLGHGDPGYSESLPNFELADLRIYVHGAQGPLSGAALHTIAFASSSAVLNNQDQCFPVDSPEMKDKMWKDEFGHDCLWFSSARKISPSVCKLNLAAQNCPISCGSKQECYTKPHEFVQKVKFAFDSIQLIQTSHAKGTVCMGRPGGSGLATPDSTPSNPASTRNTLFHFEESTPDRRKAFGMGADDRGGGRGGGGEGGGGGGVGLVRAINRPPPVGVEQKNEALQRCRQFAQDPDESALVCLMCF